MSKRPTAEEIAEMADKGEDVTPYLSKPKRSYAKNLRLKNIKRTTIDFGVEMLTELDQISSKLNISRQAVVKMALQEFLIRYHISEGNKKASIHNQGINDAGKEINV